MGSNDKETKFRVLAIDRTAGTDLNFYEYPNEYDARGIRSIVGTLGQCKVTLELGLLGPLNFVVAFFILFIFTENQCLRFIGFHTFHGELLYDFGDETYQMRCHR